MPSSKNDDKEYLQARKHTGEAQSNMVAHEEAKESIGLALLVVDVINDIDFEGNEHIVKCARPMAEKIRDLIGQCRDLRVPIIYCNDNFGKWNSDIREIYEHVINDNTPGKPIAEMLKPQKEDYFVLKPKHSAFYGSALDHLLTYLRTKSLIIVGMAGNVCILFTANDAYMRDFATFVPSDCIASSTPEEHSAALLLMERVLRTNTSPSTDLDLKKIVDTHNSHASKKSQQDLKAKERQQKRGKEEHGEDMGWERSREGSNKRGRTERTGKGGCGDPKGECE
ncbi:hypothetical protein HDV00_005282 [Rhizophlyctis rosea]|nr:hypothetical protein HDV00_005282 [Rhizophlyctis rosea]